MPVAQKKKPGKTPKLPATPIDERKRQLLEEERQLKEAEAACKRVIDEAPRKQQELARVAREELIRSRSRGPAQVSGIGTRLYDPRASIRIHTTAVPRLRSERSQERLTFVILVLVLTGLLVWVYFLVHRT